MGVIVFLFNGFILIVGGYVALRLAGIAIKWIKRGFDELMPPPPRR